MGRSHHYIHRCYWSSAVNPLRDGGQPSLALPCDSRHIAPPSQCNQQLASRSISRTGAITHLGKDPGGKPCDRPGTLDPNRTLDAVMVSAFSRGGLGPSKSPNCCAAHDHCLPVMRSASLPVGDLADTYGSAGVSMASLPSTAKAFEIRSRRYGDWLNPPTNTIFCISISSGTLCSNNSGCTLMIKRPTSWLAFSIWRYISCVIPRSTGSNIPRTSLLSRAVRHPLQLGCQLWNCIPGKQNELIFCVRERRVGVVEGHGQGKSIDLVHS